jgi:hypothetical protein
MQIKMGCKPLFRFLCLVALVWVACRKEQPEDNTLKTYPLNVGDYWVYQKFSIQPDGRVTLLPEFDSTFILKDTILHGETYRVLQQYNFDASRRLLSSYRALLRDSAGYVVDERGSLFYFPESRTDILRYDTIRVWQNGMKELAYLYYSFENRDTTISTPSGLFKCVNLRTKFQFLSPFSFDCRGCTPQGIHYSHSFYSRGVGKVREVGFADYRDPNLYGKNLIRYRVAP